MISGAAGPHFEIEQVHLGRGTRLVAGMDEVGRGALAGPVSVGVTVVGAPLPEIPEHLRDSKLLKPARREALRPILLSWGVDRAVAHASNSEIDRLGIVAALRLAGERALAALDVVPDLVILDGSHDWLSRPADELDIFSDSGAGEVVPGAVPEYLGRIVTQVKGDLICASIAAASVLAKTERDAMMVAYAAEEPRYGWAENKGYGAQSHRDAIGAHGPSALHRVSWKLPAPSHTP